MIHSIQDIKHSVYINLEHRRDRKEHVEKQMASINIPVERFNAIRLKNGAIGCSMSHVKCLETAKKMKLPHILICEDDIAFTNPYLFKENLAKFEENEEINWDLLIIGGNNVPPFQQVTEYCARVFYCQTTTGYVVKKHYYDTLLQNFKESAKMLMMNPANHSTYALDMYWKRLQRQDFWYMITPATVIQYESYSDIEGRVVNYENAMLDLEKPWLNR